MAKKKVRKNSLKRNLGRKVSPTKKGAFTESLVCSVRLKNKRLFAREVFLVVLCEMGRSSHLLSDGVK